MGRSFGPLGWFEPSSDEDLRNEAISWIEEEAMWQFLYDSIHHPRTKKVVKDLLKPKSLVTWEKFRVEKRSRRPLAMLRDHYVTQMAPNLYKAKMPMEDKLKCFYGLEIPIIPGFLDPLLRTSTVDVDRDGCITFFQHNIPGGLILGLEEENSRLRHKEAHAMMQFFHKKIFSSDAEFKRKMIDVKDPKVWQEFKRRKKNLRNVKFLMEKFQDVVAPNFDTNNYNFPLRTKMKMHFALDIPVNAGFLNVYKDCKSLEIDDMNYIVRCSLPPENEKESLEQDAINEREMREMWLYVYMKLRDPKTGTLCKPTVNPSTHTFWTDFKPSVFHKKQDCWYAFLYTKMQPKLEELNIEKKLKVSLLSALEIPISLTFYAQLRKNAFVELSRSGCILKYRESLKRPHSETTCEEDVVVLPIDEKAKELIKDWRETEDTIIWMFVIAKCRTEEHENVMICLRDPETWNEFPSMSNSCDSPAENQARFFNILLPNIHNANLGDLIKLELYLALKIPTPPDFMKNVVRCAVGDKIVHNESTNLCEIEEQETSVDPEILENKEIWEMNEIQNVVESLLQNLDANQ